MARLTLTPATRKIIAEAARCIKLAEEAAYPKQKLGYALRAAEHTSMIAFGLANVAQAHPSVEKDQQYTAIRQWVYKTDARIESVITAYDAIFE